MRFYFLSLQRNNQEMEINLRVEGSMDHFGGKKRHSINKSQNGDLIKLTVTHAWGLANCYRITQPLIMVKCQTSLSSVSLEEVVFTAQVGFVLQPSTLELLEHFPHLPTHRTVDIWSQDHRWVFWPPAQKSLYNTFLHEVSNTQCPTPSL